MVETEQIFPENSGCVWQAVSGGQSGWNDQDPRARQQEAVLDFFRRANARPPLSVLMRDAVEMVTEVIEADLGGVGVVVTDEEVPSLTLTIGTSGRQSDGDAPVVHKSLLDDDDSMAVHALKTASTVVATDLKEEERFTDAHLLERGIVSALAVPLHLNQEPFGLLGVYSKRRREFTRDEIHFAETIAYQLISSIVQMKAEHELRQQREFVSKLLEGLDAMVLQLDAEGKLLDINRACRELTGFSIEEVIEEPFCSVFVPPKDVELFQEIFRGIARNTSPRRFDSRRFESRLLTKDGSLRNVSWSLSVLYGCDKAPRSIVLTGIDQTELFALQRESLLSADPPGEKQDVEKRTSPRNVFHYEQLIAPIYGGVIPTQKNFFKVTCENISAGGISFLLDERPDYQSLVVALGQGSAVRYLTARVAHVVEKQQGDKKLYVVGCRFSGRIYL